MALQHHSLHYLFGRYLPLEIVGDILDWLPGEDVCTLMKAEPRLTVALYNYGLRPGRHWPNSGFRTKADLEAFHRRISGQVPAPDDVIDEEMWDMCWPLEWFISQDDLAPLQTLYQASVWSPMGYTYRGHTFLYFALRHQSMQVVNWLMDLAGPGHLVKRCILPAFNNEANWDSHLDAVAQFGDEELWNLAWKKARGSADPADDISYESYRHLCGKVTGSMAKDIYWISRQPDRRGAPLRRTNIAKYRALDDRRNAWHYAVLGRNPHDDFLDWAARFRKVRQRINDRDDAQERQRSALYYAWRFEDLGMMQKLIDRGAHASAFANGDDTLLNVIMRELPDPDDPYFRFIFEHSTHLNRGDMTETGESTLHALVDGVRRAYRRIDHDERIPPRRKKTAKRKETQRAIELAKIILAGNGVSTYDLRPRNLQNRTPEALARRVGAHELADFFRCAFLESEGLKHIGHRYHLRRRPGRDVIEDDDRTRPQPPAGPRVRPQVQLEADDQSDVQSEDDDIQDQEVEFEEDDQSDFESEDDDIQDQQGQNQQAEDRQDQDQQDQDQDQQDQDQQQGQQQQGQQGPPGQPQFRVNGPANIVPRIPIPAPADLYPDYPPLLRIKIPGHYYPRNESESEDEDEDEDEDA